MKRLRWHQLIAINLGWLGLGITSASMTPLILPFMVQQFVPDNLKNTLYGQLRFYGLMVALFVQPLAGMLSDRCGSRLGRRRPYVLAGALLSSLAVGALGLATGYWFLFAASLFQQAGSNTAHGALQGLIPDLVPAEDRVKASGYKAVMELLPIVIVSFTVARMLDSGDLGAGLGFVIGAVLISMLTLVATVRDKPAGADCEERIWPRVWRIGLLAASFLVIVQGLLRATLWLSRQVVGPLNVALPTVGLAGLVAILGAIILGVWISIRLGLGSEVCHHGDFTWWVISRLLFLAAAGAVQGFALYYLQDVLGVRNAASVTAQLMMVMGGLTVVSAVLSSRLSRQFGRLPVLAGSGVMAALGTCLLVFAQDLSLVYVSGVFLGLAGGTFMATNWAVGTDLVPPEDAGRFLGISNLAGAGAGAVSNGIGGPLADYFNALQPGAGYLVAFCIFAVCFLLSSLVLFRLRPERLAAPA